MLTKYDFNEVLPYFNLGNDYSKVTAFTSGNINHTYKITYGREEYVIQNINTYVFKNPEHIMKNIKLVTEFIKNKIISEGKDPTNKVLEFLTAKDGNPWAYDSRGLFWRIYKFIPNSTTFDRATADVLNNAGMGFGEFQRQLVDFPSEKLYEIIPNFHNTKTRMDDFFKAVEEDAAGRVKSLKKEIEFFEERRDICSKLIDMRSKGEIPLRVTHNDTKCNNILIDNTTGSAICVIDLDTVMPGLAAYDFGDAVRFAANTRDEDCPDIEDVKLNFELYKAFTKGFMTALKGSFDTKEVETMAWGARIITIELASRFLADYINGDKYFKVERLSHNLDRARNQIALALDMEKNFDRMCEIVENYAF